MLLSVSAVVVGDIGRSSARERNGELRAIYICDGLQGQIGNASCKFQAVADDTGDNGLQLCKKYLMIGYPVLCDVHR
jgi:hypothetical protein